eukprot:GABV01000346.1.p3 GENE.GABV01000346.1~~GABV01000346.1.p3  ORF type:complete len:133 (-),score=19.30 GABV01000346.1:760-1158(-)
MCVRFFPASVQEIELGGGRACPFSADALVALFSLPKLRVLRISLGGNDHIELEWSDKIATAVSNATALNTLQVFGVETTWAVLPPNLQGELAVVVPMDLRIFRVRPPMSIRCLCLGRGWNGAKASSFQVLKK